LDALPATRGGINQSLPCTRRSLKKSQAKAWQIRETTYNKNTFSETKA
jgi:hypothetical protein